MIFKTLIKKTLESQYLNQKIKGYTKSPFTVRKIEYDYENDAIFFFSDKNGKHTKLIVTEIKNLPVVAKYTYARPRSSY